MKLSIAELAQAVDRSENLVRQHIRRKHLSAEKAESGISVDLEEAARWARARGLSFQAPAGAISTGAAMASRTARMTVLSWNDEGQDQSLWNLFTLVRHRHVDALGPWAGEPAGTWSEVGLGCGVRLWTFDGPLERCLEHVEQILESGTLGIGDCAIGYDVVSVCYRHWAYRDDRPGADQPMRSPFSLHSAELVEYWSFSDGLRTRWLEALESWSGDQSQIAKHMGFPLDRHTDRVGNVMIAGAQDAITCDLRVCRNNTLALDVDSRGALPEAYHASVWASYSGNEVLRRMVTATRGNTPISVDTKVDHIGFALFRDSDGQCIDLMEVFLSMEVNIGLHVSTGRTMNFTDEQGQSIHKVSLPGIRSQMTVQGDIEKGGIDRRVRQRWLGNRAYVREAKARAERNVVRFGPDEVDGAIDFLIGMLASSADREEPIYFADPYFMNRLKGDRGARLYLDMFASTSDGSLRILCGERLTDAAKAWWLRLPGQIRKHISVRSFLKQGTEKPGFHDRYLITPERELIITNSISGWDKEGVTFASVDFGVYRAEAENLWAMNLDSASTPLFARALG